MNEPTMNGYAISEKGTANAPLSEDCLKISDEVTKALIERFTLTEQNAILRLTKANIVSYRQQELDKHEQACKALSEALNTI